MNAVLSVLGKDTFGILSTVSTECSKYKANIVEVSQTILEGYFAMIMLVNVDELTIDFNEFVDKMKIVADKKNLDIHVMHEDIFNSMHKI